MMRAGQIGRAMRYAVFALALVAGGVQAQDAPDAVASAATPRAAPYRIGLITYAGGGIGRPVKAELEKLGYREGENVIYREWSGNRDPAIMPRLAQELVAWKPDVILSMMTNAHVAVRDATRDAQIPVVLWSADPQETGVIQSFRHTGTNFTGFTYEPYQAILHLRFLKFAFPDLKCVGHLYNHTYAPAPSTLRDLKVAAGMMGIEVVVGEALTKEEFEPQIAKFRDAGCQAFTVGPHELFNGNGRTIGELALKYRLGAISIQGSIVNGGGLAAYAPPHDRGWPVMASMADRILRGEKPQDIPVERRLGSPLIINLKTAKALGLSLPPSLIDEADRVIE
ncbi:MAG TPA: ABC transporter substrate-binding protein [Croceibacterium sp.]|nr:ABC transporter substrate-binding protein [Croceibacterium sp.]